MVGVYVMNDRWKNGWCVRSEWQEGLQDAAAVAVAGAAGVAVMVVVVQGSSLIKWSDLCLPVCGPRAPGPPLPHPCDSLPSYPITETSVILLHLDSRLWCLVSLAVPQGFVLVGSTLDTMGTSV